MNNPEDTDAAAFLDFIKPEFVVARINQNLPLTRLQKACLEYVNEPSTRTQAKLVSVRSGVIKAYTRRK